MLEVKLTLALRVREGDKIRNEFYPLSAEFSKINSLVLNWTIVHPITEESPLFGLTFEELKTVNAEILVFVKAFDEVFANTVVGRTSYTADEFVENAKFKSMYQSSDDGKTTILNVDKLNDYEMLDLKSVN